MLESFNDLLDNLEDPYDNFPYDNRNSENRQKEKPYSECISKIGSKVRSLAARQGIATNSLAKKIGINATTLRTCMNGNRAVGINMLIPIADYFNISLDELCCRTPDLQGRVQDKDVGLLVDFLELADEMIGIEPSFENGLDIHFNFDRLNSRDDKFFEERFIKLIKGYFDMKTAFSDIPLKEKLLKTYVDEAKSNLSALYNRQVKENDNSKTS